MDTEFTPVASLVGGGLIGLTAALLMLGLGRVMGVSGLLAGAVAPSTPADERSWRVALLLGMFAAPAAYFLATGAVPEIQTPLSAAALIGGGLLVGIGVTIGSGCTSGHGVCGLARFSRRSLAAVATFMATTAATVFIVRHVLGA